MLNPLSQANYWFPLRPSFQVFSPLTSKSASLFAFDLVALMQDSLFPADAKGTGSRIMLLPISFSESARQLLPARACAQAVWRHPYKDQAPSASASGLW